METRDIQHKPDQGRDKKPELSKPDSRILAKELKAIQ